MLQKKSQMADLELESQESVHSHNNLKSLMKRLITEQLGDTNASLRQYRALLGMVLSTRSLSERLSFA